MPGNSVNQILETFGAEKVEALVNNLNRLKKTAAGGLHDSVKFTIKTFGNVFEFNLILADYYKYVDEGRKPGKGVPFKPKNILLHWIGQKQIATSDQKGYFKNKAAGKVTIASNISRAKSIAFLINRKIKRFGIKPTHFYSDVINDSAIKELRRDLSRAVKKDVLLEIKQF